MGIESKKNAPGRGRRYSADEIGRLLADATRPGARLTEVLARHRVSAKTYYLWKARLSGVRAKDVKRVQRLEDELRRLRRRFEHVNADLRVLQVWVKDLLRTSGQRREAASALRRANAISDRRACAILGIARTSRRDGHTKGGRQTA